MTIASKLILASGSPRRRELLTREHIDFEVMQSGLDEIRHPDEAARDYALRMARDKALAVSALHPQRSVLAADTVVECEGKILEKPLDATDATRMLSTLAGRTHTVVTAFALATDVKIVASEAVISRVTFRALIRRRDRDLYRLPASRSTKPAPMASRVSAAALSRMSMARATT